MALVEFGSRAYVITPFTSDYDNLLLSMALIGDPVEFSTFPESGTVIASALEESIEIFKAFDFLEASGNLMVIFTDGEDTTSIVHGRSLDDILKSAIDNKIPLYFVRTNYEKEFGEGIPDAKWRAAVEKTGGRYYVAKNEATLIAAVDDIDREAVGAISARQYTSQQPRFTLVRARGVCVLDGGGRPEGRRRRGLDGSHENDIHCRHVSSPRCPGCRRLAQLVRIAAGRRGSPMRSRTIATLNSTTTSTLMPARALSDYLPGDRRRLSDEIRIAKRDGRVLGWRVYDVGDG